MSFLSVEFPTNIAVKSTGGPEWSTEIIKLGNGKESRNIRWAYPLERWTVAYGALELSELQDLNTFFNLVQGRAYSFKFVNYYDHRAGDTNIGTGDGVTSQFQARKEYTVLTSAFVESTVYRKITKVDEDGDIDGNSLAVYVNGAPVSATVSASTGIITILAAAPGTGDEITADFDFWIPMRFDSDHLPVSIEGQNAAATTIDLVEVDE